MKKWNPIKAIQKGGPWRSPSSVEQSRGQKVRSDTKGNGLYYSTNVDKYPEGTGQRKAMKYLKEKLLPLH